MNSFLAQMIEPSAFNAPAGSSRLFVMLILTLLVGAALFVGFMFLPTRARRPVVAAFTFVSGLFWVLVYFWPTPQARGPMDQPRSFTEAVGFFIADGIPIAGTIANILTTFLLGLGIYSLLRIHVGKLVKKQKDWGFSILFLGAMLAMIGFGYWDWHNKLSDPSNNDNIAALGRDFLFNGLLQQMDAAMFSLIAFFILSAAYRAFRIRSIESTILLATALVVMLSLMGLVEYGSAKMIDAMTGQDSGSLLNNLKLTEVYGWIRNNVQTPSLRALDFGIGIGALAMGLRLWLSLEKGGVST